ARSQIVPPPRKTAIGGVRVGRIAAGRRENSRVDVRGSQNTLVNEDACSGRMDPYPVGVLRPDNCGYVKADGQISACGATNRLNTSVFFRSMAGPAAKT